MRALFCLLSVGVSTSAFAQEIPTPKPGEGHKLFAKEVGTWDCAVKMYFQGPDGPASESKGLEVNRLVSGDLYLLTKYTGTMAGAKFEGHGLVGYNPHSKEYLTTWVDNFSVVPSHYKGEYNKEQKTMTAHGEVVEPTSGQKLKQKHVTTWISDDKKKFEIYLIMQGNEIKLMESVCTKRKS